MLIHLLNFPEFARQAVAQILSEYGHTTAALPYAGLFESIDPGESFPLVLVYDYAVSEETTSLYHQLNVRFPGSVVWLVCPSYRPEDVRTALLGGYANYILWSCSSAARRSWICTTRWISSMSSTTRWISSSPSTGCSAP